MTFDGRSSHRPEPLSATPSRDLAGESDSDSASSVGLPAGRLATESDSDSASSVGLPGGRLATESDSDSVARNLLDSPATRAESKSDSLAKRESEDLAEVIDSAADLGILDTADRQDAELSMAEERRALIDLVIYAYDRTTSAGIRSRLADGLGAVGVGVLNPDGEAFDPTRHEAGGTEATPDTARHGLVAETELAGFTDRGVVIREPVVVVYRRP